MSVQHLRTNLREIMETLGISQGEVAERSDISRVYINRILAAKADPSLGIVDQIAAGLGVSVERLLRTPQSPARKKYSEAS